MTIASLILAAAEEPSGVDLLLPDLRELAAAVIAFGIVFFVIWKKAIPAFNEIMEKREAAIKGELEEAEATKAEAAKLLSDYQAQVAGAQQEANKIIDEARQAAEGVRAQATERAQTEAADIVSKARGEAGLEKARVVAEARQDVKSLSIDIAEKVVGKNLDRSAQDSLVESFLADLERAGE